MNLGGETVAAKPTYLHDTQHVLERAQTAFEHGRLKEAIELLEQAVSMGADSAATRTMAGIACARVSQVDRALTHLERAVELAPDAFAPRCALGELHLRLCAVDRGKEQLARALESASNAAERAYVAGLLREDRTRAKRRIQRPSFHKPFWSRRRPEGSES